MNTCNTCAHWASPQWRIPESHGECEAIPFIKVTFDEPPAGPYVIDGEDYWANLVTPADFGCTLWMEKPAGTAPTSR
jgi:hypothetical protein